MNLVKVYGKAVAAFVATVVGNMVVNLVNGVAPWPSTGGQWVQFVVTSFGTAIAVWIAPSKITQKQLDNDPHVIGGTVVDDPHNLPAAQQPANPPKPGTYRNPWES